MSTRVVGASLVIAMCACSARPPAPQLAESDTYADGGVPDLGALVWLGATDDRVQVDDGPIHPDGRRDYAFAVRLSGPVVSLTLTLSDLHGRRVGSSVWDTITGTTVIPSSLDVPMKLGRETAQLAIYDGGGHLLDPQGSLPANTVFDGSRITVVAPDWGSEFHDPGRAFTLVVLRPDGHVDRTTAVIL